MEGPASRVIFPPGVPMDTGGSVMRAFRGFSGGGALRARRLLGCVVALVALAAMAFAPAIASAHKTPKIRKSYLALGDSLAFGYSQQLFNENEKTGESPSAFENGYTNDYLAKINTGGDYQLINLGCPGETSASLIGTKLAGELNAALAGELRIPITGEEPCEYHRVFGLPLHHEYGGTKSQLESALATIAEERAKGTPVKIVTLNDGANDELHAVAKIEKEAEVIETERVTEIAKGDVTLYVLGKAKEEVSNYVIEQVIPQAFEESGGIPPTFEEDIAIDAAAYAAAHAHELELKVFEDAAIYAATHEAELKKLGEEKGLEYEETHAEELKKEGEAILRRKFVEDSPALFEQIITNVDATVIALRDIGGYKGPIIFQGGYDPYGNLTGEREVLEGSNESAEILNQAMKANVTMKRIGGAKFKLCFVNPHPTWNPGLPNEPVRLFEWTNMDNTKEFEGKKDGPDIHPTPAGYAELADEMFAACG